MSVIATWEATPNRVAIVYRFLDAQNSPISEELLLSLLSPVTLQKKGGDGEEKESVVAVRVLSECKSLGLVEVRPEDGALQVPLAKRGMDDAGLRTLFERQLTNPDLAADSGQDQVPYALAWFLNQSPAQPLAFRENQAEIIRSETGGRSLELTSVSSFQQFSYWVRYLGLGWRIPSPSAGVDLVSDPTDGLALHLEAILAGAGSMPIHEAIEALGRRLPVLETGVAREEVEKWLPENKRRSDNDLSPSTSLALSRLQMRGLIDIEEKADASGMRLLTWPTTRRISHLIWTRKPTKSNRG